MREEMASSSWLCVCVCVCARACVRVRACACDPARTDHSPDHDCPRSLQQEQIVPFSFSTAARYTPPLPRNIGRNKLP